MGYIFDPDNIKDYTCPICGDPTNVYMGNARKDRLCRKHGALAKKGEIIQCEDCGKWNESDPFLTCSCKKSAPKKIVKKPPETEKQEHACIICGETTENGWQYLCSTCYSKSLEYTKEMNKNYSVQEFKNYYFNAKSNIYTLTGFEKFIKPNCIKLVAIAKACGRYAQNDTLLGIVKQDIQEIIAKKKEKDIIQESEEHKVVEFNTKKNRGAIRGVDGHFLDSDKEKQIDDLLFSLAIPHAIHYSVPEINERTVNCDWYIPVIPGKGIYMEYFGMDTNDYIQNREEKIELYQKHKLKLIKIEKDETLDTQKLSHHIQQEYKNLKSEIFSEAQI